MEEPACLPSLTGRIQLQHFSSPGNPLSQSLAMTTDTGAGRRQRPCHVIEIVLLTEASLLDPHSRVGEPCGLCPARGPAMGRGSALLGAVLSEVQSRLPGRLGGTVSMSSTVGESLSAGKSKKKEGQGNSG